MSAPFESAPPEALALVEEAKSLLSQANKLLDAPGSWWAVTRITTDTRPPLALDIPEYLRG